MKRIFLFFLLFFSLFNAKAQYGVEGAIYTALMIGIRVPEMKHLREIADAQTELVTLSAVIALETTAITVIEQKILDAQKEVSPLIGQLQYGLKITKLSEAIVSRQSKIFDLVQDMPELLPLAIQSELTILVDAMYLMNDALIATKENKTNLLSNKDRIDILINTEESLKILNRDSYLLYDFLYTVSLMEEVPVNFSIDVSQTLEEHLDFIENNLITE